LATLAGWIGVKAQAVNPVIFADVPDMSIVRVGSTFYMSSTTMHMSPGVPIMKSTDLVNWQVVGYAYDTLAGNDALNLANGKNAYGSGSWASSLRYHKGVYYVSTFSQTTRKTYIFSTRNIEKGPWKRQEFAPSYHDHTLFFDDDGKGYMIYGVGRLKLLELNEDLSGPKPGAREQIIIENASAPAGANIMLQAEGSQLFKVNGKYYLFNITWPRNGMRTAIVHRADKITGPYEGRLALQHRGIAQGGLIDMPDGRWFAYLFRDYGAVGRIPYLAPVQWQDAWPMIGQAGKVPDTLALKPSEGLIPGLVAPDNFSRSKGEPALPLVWQWNHNPDDKLWSVTERPGYLRLRTGRTDTGLTQVRNILTQRTIGPACTATTLLDASHLNEGEMAGLTIFQKHYGIIGVQAQNGQKRLVMISAEKGPPEVLESLPLEQPIVYLKIEADFTNMKDEARFYYSLNGADWKPIGNTLKMAYTLPHFMGYRYGLFAYTTKQPGGYADFDFFDIRIK